MLGLVKQKLYHNLKYEREAENLLFAHKNYLPPRQAEQDCTMSTAENLKEMGLKATGPRLKILNLFEQSGTRHLSAEDVYRMLIADNVEIGLATVYRVLTQFEQAGLLIRHHFETGKAVFELNQGEHHDHLVCVNCNRVEEFYDPEIEKRQEKIAKQYGFQIQDHEMYLYGICRECKSSQ